MTGAGGDHAEPLECDVAVIGAGTAGLAAEGYGRAVLTHLDGVAIRQQLRLRIAARCAAA
ncbi:hypothetical protein [Brevundimonas sp.]|jgi:hypothetical protein|uniref:hypothetical protein n=1 Tax=Brevundimonas sp. TaxID=1871086 RepID=UPI0037BF1987